MRTIFSLLLCVVSLCVSAQDLTVVSYNIRYLNTKDSLAGNAWSQRLPYIVQLIRFHGFDVFGTQEATYPQLQDLTAQLDDFAYVGVGRNDGATAGEFSAIFYNTNRVKLLDSGTFWLSENTEKPNVGWDAKLPRICTWAFFKDLKSGAKFYFYNTHFDHVGVRARAESARLIVSRVAERKKYPVILTGDFNSDQHSEAYAVFVQSGILSDAYESAEVRYAPNGTFNNFNATLLTDSRLDHIFFTKPVRAKKYGVLTDTYRVKVNEDGFKAPNFPKEYSLYPSEARVPSDHFPVMVVLELK